DQVTAKKQRKAGKLLALPESVSKDMEMKELHLEEIQNEHPFILIDLQLKYQDLDEDDDDDDDDDDDNDDVVDDNDLITMKKFKCICDRCGKRINWYHQYYYKCNNISCHYSLHKFCAEIFTSL
nr:DC1, C1-like, zinc finger, RING/FYVE/PHD-type [Tanacetum cinerariifolium]